MTQRDILRDAANDRALKVLTDNDTALIANPAYAPLKLLFDNKQTEIKATIQKMFKQTGYITYDKQLLRAIMINIYIPLLDKASNQFFVLNIPDLSLAVNIEPSFLQFCSGTICIGRTANLLGIVVANTATLTEISPADIIAMQESLQNFETVNSMPQSAIKAKKAEATSIMPNLFNEMDVIKDKMKKHIRGYNSDLLELWVSENKVGSSLGARQISLNLHITDTVGGVVLRNVICTITNGTDTIVLKSSKKGFRKFYSLTAGLWNVTASLPNYELFKQNEVAIEDNNIVVMEISLKKKTLPDATEGTIAMTVTGNPSGNKLAGITLSIPFISKSWVSDINGLINATGLTPAAYAAVLTGTNIITKYSSISINAGKTTTISMVVEEK